MNVSRVPSVYIIILHWKAYYDTHTCLLSLKTITYPNYQVIVVDNFSNDGSAEKLRDEFPEHVFVFNKGNLGFSCGCNAGMRAAYDLGADYVLLLNNDMKVESGFLEPAVAEAEKSPAVGAVTGKIMFQENPNTFWQAGGYIHPFRVQGVPRGKDEADHGQYEEICNTGWASGAMSLISRHALEEVGYLPEEYFFGQEEWDYSTAILRAGLKIRYVPKMKAYHHAGASYHAGHPVLNVYGGYLSKMIYAEKYMSPLMFKFWRLCFWAYLKLRWPTLAGQHCNCDEDYRVSLRAGFMAFEDHKRVKRVGLKELEDAALRLGPTPTWGDGWQPREVPEELQEKAI
ncbi:glycosyltransferase family 2 protein [Geobacter sp.]|uniref:glycosyltransferase family 2 protein n=1 Tax=Geobacter sp. TaxID=46610 RepID=UPI0027B99F9B|nr:glycosyltransferase family 2 protein [Geobacter sp.]